MIFQLSASEARGLSDFEASAMPRDRRHSSDDVALHFAYFVDGRLRLRRCFSIAECYIFRRGRE